jgi:hAT family C-terminal dimerisation region
MFAVLAFGWGSLAKHAKDHLKSFLDACSTASCERNFSTFGFIHSKLRNKLSEQSVRKLVYIKTNALQLSGAIANDIDSDETECDSQFNN